MKYHKKLGQIMEIKDLRKSQRKFESIMTITEIKGIGFLNKISYLGVIVSHNKAYFLNLENPMQPSIISTIDLHYDHMYANRFLGIYKNYALFGIAYEGIEVVDINNLQNPKSLGLLREYDSPFKMIFKNNLAINERGIFEISDILQPRALKKFEEDIFDILVIEDNFIYSSDNGIQLIKFDNLKNYNVCSRITHEFMHGQIALQEISEKYFMAVSDGIGFFEILSPDRKIGLKALIDLEVVPDNFFVTDKTCIVRTIPYHGHILVSFNIKDLLNPKLIFALDTKELWHFTANQKFIVYLSGSNADMLSSEKSLFILEHYIDAPPDLITIQKMESSSNYTLIDNIIYIFEKDGLRIYEIQ